MAVYLVTYDLKAPGRNYQPVYDYLKRFIYCKKLESVWLVQTSLSASTIRDNLERLIDANDVIFVVQITASADWAACRYGCGSWLNEPSRSF
ncbi:MAG TPA: SinR family protein [Nitrosospira sp.]|nr:SinR family protein [Nitrosospira sp.]